MARFLTEADYTPTIKAEIKTLITGSTETAISAKQLIAEDTAISMITEYIGSKYDCAVIFAQTGTARNLFMVNCVVIIVLYMMYKQTGAIDIPQHRVDDYDDIVKWLDNVGRGEITTTLPALPDANFVADLRLNSRPYINQKW